MTGDSLLDGIELVIFDKDGTLIDFDAMWGPWVLAIAADLEAAVDRPIATDLLDFLGFDAITGRTVAGGPLAAMSMARLRELTEARLVDGGVPRGAAAAAMATYWQPPDPVALAVPIVPLGPLFDSLIAAGRRVAIATSDDRPPTERTLAALGVADRVAAVVCADDGVDAKPSGAMVRHLCRRLGVAAPRTAVVGDAPGDLAMGRAAAVGLVVGVLSGVGSADDLTPLADRVIVNAGELARI